VLSPLTFKMAKEELTIACRS